MINKEIIQPKQIEKEPIYIFKTPEAQKWDPLLQRFVRSAIVNNLPLDMTRLQKDQNYRKRFRRLALTGAHEAGHMRGARQVAELTGAKVFENGNGITTFRMRSVSLEQFVRDINYIGFLGKATEEALGETPHGHGFDMMQNDMYAQLYAKKTGYSGSALQSEASRMASSETRSNLDSIVDEGVQLALAA